MLWLFMLAAATMVELHGPDGQIIWLNPAQVINIREPRGIDSGHWTKGTKCLVLTVDGKFFTTAESCVDVRRRLEGAGQPP
jgi:hypothetical protein